MSAPASRAGSTGLPPPSQGLGRAGSAPGAPRGSPSSGPPSCPKCELTKSQFTRTVQNYQKAYRKKVESLRTELGATRGRVVQAERKIKQLQGIARFHLPSTAVGVLLGVLATKHFGQVTKSLKTLFNKSKRLSAAEQQPTADSSADENTDVQHAAESAEASSQPAALAGGNGSH